MKRKKLIISSVALVLCLSLFTFGVFAVISPKVSISGKVSYQIKDAEILVQGKIMNAKDYETEQAVHSADYSTVEINSQSQYYKNSADLAENETELEQWDISTLTFSANGTEFNPVTISIKFTNYSNYGVSGSVTFNTETLNGITRQTNIDTSSINLAANGELELVITYTLIDKNIDVNLTDIGMTISLSK